MQFRHGWRSCFEHTDTTGRQNLLLLQIIASGASYAYARRAPLFRCIAERNPRQKAFGAEGGTRTPTPLRVHGPEPCASANSTTSARIVTAQRERPGLAATPSVPNRRLQVKPAPLRRPMIRAAPPAMPAPFAAVQFACPNKSGRSQSELRSRADCRLSAASRQAPAPSEPGRHPS